MSLLRLHVRHCHTGNCPTSPFHFHPLNICLNFKADKQKSWRTTYHIIDVTKLRASNVSLPTNSIGGVHRKTVKWKVFIYFLGLFCRDVEANSSSLVFWRANMTNWHARNESNRGPSSITDFWAWPLEVADLGYQIKVANGTSSRLCFSFWPSLKLDYEPAMAHTFPAFFFQKGNILFLILNHSNNCSGLWQYLVSLVKFGILPIPWLPLMLLFITQMLYGYYICFLM